MQKKAGGHGLMVECLPYKCKALSSNPSTTKKEKRTITIDSTLKEKKPIGGKRAKVL
jgi:hypothetical protein